MTAIGVESLSLWLPGRGLVLDDVSFAAPSGITLLTGRSGSGASLLLAALADRLPVGGMHRGSVRAPRPEQEGALTVLPRALSDQPIVDVVGAASDQELLADLAIVPSQRPASSVPASQRAALSVLWALSQPRTRLLVLDQPLAGLRPEHRLPVVAAIRRRADAGACVIWAEHHLEDALDAADQVVELVAGGALTSSPNEWSPRTLPLPPHRAAARGLGLPRQEWPSLAALGAHPVARLAIPRSTGGTAGEPLVVAAGSQNGLGVDLELRHRETIGVVDAGAGEARVLNVARRLTAIARGQQVLPRPLILPRAARVDRVVRSWAKARGVVPQAAWDRCPTPLDPRRLTSQHSTGERAALRWALATGAGEAVLLVHPEAGLDAANRRLLANRLRERPEATSVLVTHDPELMVRSCHRLVAVGADGSVEVGAPARIADRLPAPPILRRAGLRALRVSDLLLEDR